MQDIFLIQWNIGYYVAKYFTILRKLTRKIFCKYLWSKMYCLFVFIYDKFLFSLMCHLFFQFYVIFLTVIFRVLSNVLMCCLFVLLRNWNLDAFSVLGFIVSKGQQSRINMGLIKKVAHHILVLTFRQHYFWSVFNKRCCRSISLFRFAFLCYTFYTFLFRIAWIVCGCGHLFLWINVKKT